jgi:hypothetical protein
MSPGPTNRPRAGEKGLWCERPGRSGRWAPGGTVGAESGGGESGGDAFSGSGPRFAAPADGAAPAPSPARDCRPGAGTIPSGTIRAGTIPSGTTPVVVGRVTGTGGTVRLPGLGQRFFGREVGARECVGSSIPLCSATGSIEIDPVARRRRRRATSPKISGEKSISEDPAEAAAPRTLFTTVQSAVRETTPMPSVAASLGITHLRADSVTKAGITCHRNSLSSAVDSELAENSRYMIANGFFANLKPRGYSVVVEALRDKFQHLTLT